MSIMDEKLINTEYEVEEKRAPWVKRKCDGCEAIVWYRKNMPVIKKCVDCRDGITQKKIIDIDSKENRKSNGQWHSATKRRLDDKMKALVDYESRGLKYKKVKADKINKEKKVKVDKKDIKYYCIDCGEGLNRKKKRCDKCAYKHRLKMSNERNYRLRGEKK